MTKILVTGGAGFIGSNFIKYMLREHPQYHIVLMDAFTYASNIPPYLYDVKDRITVRVGDVCIRSDVDQTFFVERPDIVVNFAAETHVDRSIRHPDRFLRTNVIGTSMLMDASLNYGVRRFHQVSTDEVYGELPIDRPDLKFSESSPLRPCNPYSVSKASADMLAISYFRTHGLPLTISRSSNNYGRNQHFEKLIPNAIGRIAWDVPVDIYGNGMNVREWIHVDDHCRAIDMILHGGTEGEIYNVGSGVELSNVEMVSTLFRTFGREPVLRYVEDRKGHDLRYALDCSKIRRDLGWKPQVRFEDGIRDTVDWYRNNAVTVSI